MNKMNIYEKLPYPLKTISASIWGYYLNWWRYGLKTDKLVEIILERESWSQKQWKKYVNYRLEFILNHAATKVPYYRNYWSNRRKNGDNSSCLYLENWPILHKEELRKNPRAFISEDSHNKLMYKDHTGGTTGTPLTIYESRSTVQTWYAMQEARLRVWHDVSRKDRWAIFGGQLVVPLKQNVPPFWVESKGLNQLYLSTFHISKKNIIHYARKLNLYRPSHIIAYPSSLSDFANEILKQNIEIWSPKVIFSNAEPLYNYQRELISRAFNCKVINSYGMGEIVYGASECSHGNMHCWPDSGVLEILDEDLHNITDDREGSFIITGLINEDMPLIRYSIGDRGKPLTDSKCKCGRSLPLMDQVVGRDSDLIITPDGRKVFWLNSVFYGLDISQGQIIQESIDLIKINVIPSYGFGQSEIEIIKDRMHKRVGNEVKIDIKLVKNIKCGANGKFRPVISQIN